MPPLVHAIRPILIDMAATFLFYGVLASTGNVALATAVGVAFGVGQVILWKIRRQPISAMQWASLALVLVMGAATLVTHDARFILIKPTIVYAVIGAAMLQPGWMGRYMPPIALEKLPRNLIVGGGYVWAGLMFLSAILNLAVAFSLPAKDAALFMAIWSPASKITLFALHYATFQYIGRRKARLAQAAPQGA